MLGAGKRGVRVGCWVDCDRYGWRVGEAGNSVFVLVIDDWEMLVVVEQLRTDYPSFTWFNSYISTMKEKSKYLHNVSS